MIWRYFMTMPNFFILGAMKAGTSALYEYLKQHPQAYMSPVKEPRFFSLEGKKLGFCGPKDQEVIRSSINNIEEYYQLFQGVSNEIAIGEASVWYLYTPGTPELIQKHIPNAKLIVMLRDPVDRAYSHFLNLVRDGREPLSDFAQAIQVEKTRINNNWGWSWHYVNMGFYYSQLRRYYDIFDSSQIKIYFYEDFLTNPVDLIQNLFDYLGIEESFTPDVSRKYNVSGIPSNNVWHTLHGLVLRDNLVKKTIKQTLPKNLRQNIAGNLLKLTRNSFVKPSLSPEVRKQLIQVYREDILKLQDLTQRDLSRWLK